MSVIRHHARCDGCRAFIRSMRYKCMQCEDYDLCDSCKSAGIHSHTGHTYFTIGLDHLCNGCRTRIRINDHATQYYKCFSCESYDLCTRCKSSGKHEGHEFLCVGWKDGGLYARRSTSNHLSPHGNEVSDFVAEKFDAIALDDAMTKTVACDGCRQKPIKGNRFKCSQCANYDLCASCKSNGVHSMHSFYPVKSVEGRQHKKSGLYNPWETERDLVKIGKEIGRGSFGTVYNGLWKSHEVAIKLLQKGAMDVQSFLQEAEIMGKLKHNNILSLLSVVTHDEPILIITEFMDEGSLSTYLHKYRNALPMPTLIWIMTEVADGMRYLEETNFVHRDLAARNVLVGKGETAGGNLQIKICDFGLTRHLSQKTTASTLVYQSKSDIFPVRWTAPEAMPPRKKFTVKSDVWSFGILMTEIVTFGRVPYRNIRNEDIDKYVKSGNTMRCGELAGCPDYIYGEMKKTWNMNEKHRPTFKEIMPLLQVCFQKSTVDSAKKNRAFQ